LDGEFSLKDHQPGRLYEPLSDKFYDLVVSEWQKYRCGARKLHFVFKSKGFKVSRRKIEQVLVEEGFQKPTPKRKKPRKYKRYEWPMSNYMWHTDWHTIKASRLKGRKTIVYLDDSSRKVMGYGVGRETTKNSLFALYKAIDVNLAMPYILNSDHGPQFIANKRDKKGKATHEFELTLQELGIIFIPSKIRHPQTNGKLERFFGILDREFDDRFETLDEFMEYYNDKRPSEAVDNMTPATAYKKRL